jgi:hypothetical protein
MEFVFVLIRGGEWEDNVIFLSEKDAIDASKKHPKCRVEIFSSNNESGYTPKINYYENGILVKN